MHHRVFGLTDAAVPPTDLQAQLHAAGLPVEGRFRGDGPDPADWFAAELVFPDAAPVVVERFRTDADDLRDELNTWAAWLEAADWSPHSRRLMEQMIAVRQVFAWRRPVDHADELRLDRLCLALARLLAGWTGGFYQIDGQGFFAPGGELLVQEY
jgi:hypothetical protein